MRACQAPDDLAGPVVPGEGGTRVVGFGLHVLHKVIPGQRGEEHGAGTESRGFAFQTPGSAWLQPGRRGPL